MQVCRGTAETCFDQGHLFCLPILLYCLGALCLPQHRVRQLGVCWNDCFRQIFHYNRWDSVKELQYFCGELSFEYLYDLNKWNFFVKYA